MIGRRIRVGLIGAGRIAGFVHVPSLRLLPDLCEVTAVASRDAAKAKSFAEQWGIPRVHDTWESLVGDPELDAVVVCPPSDLNGVVAAAAVAAGKHVLCEKPLAITHPEAKALAEAATRVAGRVHMVAFTFRFAAGLRYLKRLVDEGHFGEIRHWRMSYFNDGQLDPSLPFGWRHQRARGGAGVIADMGSHMIDTARYLLGDVVAVSGVNRTYVAERPVPGGGRGHVETPEASAWVAEFASGVMGTFDVSRAVAGRGGTGRPQYQGVEIHGTGGAALYELMHPFQLQMSLGPAMARRQHWATVEVPPEFCGLSGVAAQPARRRSAPRLQVRSGRRLRPRGPRGDDGLPDLP